MLSATFIHQANLQSTDNKLFYLEDLYCLITSSFEFAKIKVSNFLFQVRMLNIWWNTWCTQSSSESLEEMIFYLHIKTFIFTVCTLKKLLTLHGDNSILYLGVIFSVWSMRILKHHKKQEYVIHLKCQLNYSKDKTL